MKGRAPNRHAIGLLAGYGLQFLAGMTLNLFVAIPDSHPGSTGGDYFIRSWHSLAWSMSDGGWLLASHAGLAPLLVLGSVAQFVLAAVFHNKLWNIAGGLAALFTIGGFFNGLSFVDYNEDTSSLIMAVTLLVVGLLLAGRKAAVAVRR